MKYTGFWQRATVSRLAVAAALAAVFVPTAFSTRLLAQGPAPQLHGTIDNSSRTALTGSRLPLATASADIGPVPADMALHGITLAFKHSAAQETALKTLIAAQQDPKSSHYHQWLTPATFAARFGVAASDLKAAQAWLESQGFTFEGVNNAHTQIKFGGTATQVAQAFDAPLHYYKGSDGKQEYAPSAELKLPTALAAIVSNVGNLSSFRPRPMIARSHAAFTSAQSGNHFLTPGDIAVIYDVNPEYTAGYTGAGQSIAVLGQSAVELSDIKNFQTAVNISANVPVPVLVPGTGTGFDSPGDESESDLDLEYAGSMAPGATVYFVYTGVSENNGVFDSAEYAIDSNIAPIISISYGVCEAALSSTNFTELNGILEEGASQGQSIIAASGDSGSTACAGDSSVTSEYALEVNFPASSQYVTGIGGTEIQPADAAASNTTYWQGSSGSSDVIVSALSYIPEEVWNNDTAQYGISAGGGGTSTFEPRPSWQTGVTGIPPGSFRLVPDVSLDSANDIAPYLFCSSDTSLDVSGSCANGLRAADDSTLTAAGGTSFATPIFAGMLAVLNQVVSANGQGVVNPTLYTLAANSTTYSSIFHDTTVGSNACTAYSQCTSANSTEYPAGTGYDEASGLGSFDFAALVQSWPAVTALAGTTTSVAASSSTPAAGANDTIIVSVAPEVSGGVLPTGTVDITVSSFTYTSNGLTPAQTTATVTLDQGQATYTVTGNFAGSTNVTAQYSGDRNYAPSTGSTTLSYPEKGITLTSTPVTVTAGSTGASTISIQPVDGYTGTLSWQVGASATINDVCVSIPDTTVTGTGTTAATLTIATNSASSVCTSSAIKVTNLDPSRKPVNKSSNDKPARPLGAPAAFSLAGLMLLGLMTPKARRIRPLLAIAFLGVMSFGITACGGGSSSSGSGGSGGTGGTGTTGTNASAGTYTLYVIGTDTTTSTVAAETSFTLTIN